MIYIIDIIDVFVPTLVINYAAVYIHTLDGREFVGLMKSVILVCAFPQIQVFYRPSQTVFSKWYFCYVGILTSEEVIVQLLKQKCLSILLYALDVAT